MRRGATQSSNYFSNLSHKLATIETKRFTPIVEAVMAIKKKNTPRRYLFVCSNTGIVQSKYVIQPKAKESDRDDTHHHQTETTKCEAAGPGTLVETDQVGGETTVATTTATTTTVATTTTTTTTTTPHIITTELNCHDVLFGRGHAVSQTKGNIHFRCVIWDHKKQYLNAAKEVKNSIGEKIINMIANLNPPGRFLERCSCSGNTGGTNSSFVLVSTTRAIEKACQALRELKTVTPPPGYAKYRLGKKKKKKKHAVATNEKQSRFSISEPDRMVPMSEPAHGAIKTAIEQPKRRFSKRVVQKRSKRDSDLSQEHVPVIAEKKKIPSNGSNGTIRSSSSSTTTTPDGATEIVSSCRPNPVTIISPSSLCCDESVGGNTNKHNKPGDVPHLQQEEGGSNIIIDGDQYTFDQFDGMFAELPPSLTAFSSGIFSTNNNINNGEEYVDSPPDNQQQQNAKHGNQWPLVLNTVSLLL